MARAFDGDWFGPYSVKSKPVRYNGSTFRSDLEARFALWWTELGFEWVFEPADFTLPDRHYLPDFRVWMMSVRGKRPFLVEVKPRSLNERERKALRDLSEQEGSTAFAFCGKPWPDEYTIAQTYRDERSGQVKIVDGGVLDQIDRDIVLVFPGRSERPTRLMAIAEPNALMRAFRLAKAAKFASAAPDLEPAQQSRMDLPGA